MEVSSSANDSNSTCNPRWLGICLTVVFLYFQGIHQLNAGEPDSLLYKNISITLKPTSLYKALNQIGDKVGCYFIYDSRDVQSSKRVRAISWNSKPLKGLLDILLADSTVRYRVIGKHILLYKPNGSKATEGNVAESNFIRLGGKVVDRETSQPLAFATVGLPSLALGTITNLDGTFTLRIPVGFHDSSVVVSHIGYSPQIVPAGLLTGKEQNVYLQATYIPIQEIFVRNLDARGTVAAAVERRNQNYFQQDIHINAFYREGVKRNRSLLSYSEAIVKLFKSTYELGPDYDQVKLIRSRKMEQANRSDTLDVKLQAGVRATLELDIMKNLPDFLDPQYSEYYSYNKNDIVTFDGRSAYVIGFEQKPGITEPLFSGSLYIDAETLAIMAAEFEINPRMVGKTASRLVVRKGRGVRVTPEKVKYWVKYQNLDGRWYPKHIRGEIELRVGTRFWPFPDLYALFFEYVGVQVETSEVKRFSRREAMKTNIVFADQNFEYDANFWGNMNFIEPEEDIIRALARIAPKVESLTDEQMN